MEVSLAREIRDRLFTRIAVWKELQSKGVTKNFCGGLVIHVILRLYLSQSRQMYESLHEFITLINSPNWHSLLSALQPLNPSDSLLDLQRDTGHTSKKAFDDFRTLIVG
jgi:hypothetical protein